MAWVWGVHKWYDLNAPKRKRKTSKIARVNMSKAHTGKILSIEHKQNISKALQAIKGKLSEAHKGSKAYNWLGGISKLPYSFEFDNILKQRIKARDREKCQECGSTYRLCIHHINYDKQDNREENLITLCIRCHMKSNFDRKEWENYFSGKLRYFMLANLNSAFKRGQHESDTEKGGRGLSLSH